MKNNFLVFSLLFFNYCYSQTPNWSWAKNFSIYFNGNGRKFTAIDSSGNSYLVGDFSSPKLIIDSIILNNSSSNGKTDIYLIKFSSTGHVLWAENIGGLDYDSPNAITTDSVGNLFITGAFWGSITLGSITLVNNGYGCFIAKLDKNGKIIWVRSNSNIEDKVLFNSIKLDKKGFIYLAGALRSKSMTFGNVSLNYDDYGMNKGPRSMVAKFDAQGNCLWAKAGQCNDENVFGNNANDVAVDDLGNVYITGDFSNNRISFDSLVLTKTDTGAHSISNLYIVKYNSDGQILWGYRSQGNCKTINIDKLNNLYACGPNSGITKFDPSGTIKWTKILTSYGGFYFFESSAIDPIGNLYIAGLFDGQELNFGDNIVLTNTGEGSLFIAKYNSSGRAMWAKKAGSLNINNEIAIVSKMENEVFIAGTFDNMDINFGNINLIKDSSGYDLFLAKLSLDSIVSTERFKQTNIKLYPNPASTIIQIENIDINTAYQIYDMNGMRLITGCFKNNCKPIDISSLQHEVYLIKLSNKLGVFKTIKFIVQ